MAQLYVSSPGKAAERPARLLKGFQRLTIAPGATRTVRLSVRLDDLRWWNPETRTLCLEGGCYLFRIGGSSASDDLISSEITL